MARRTERKHSSGNDKRKTIITICAITTALAVVICAYFPLRSLISNRRLARQQESLADARASTITDSQPFEVAETAEPTLPAVQTPEPTPVVYEYLSYVPKYLDRNKYYIGWLQVDDTVIDYPVVQTPEDEEMYLYLDFDGEYNLNGTLIMDTDSEVGVGTAAFDYRDGKTPSTNLSIHGHTMKSGAMFGHLKYYQDEDYGKEHNIIEFDSLYEHREYELISCFYTQVYYESQDVFKYYKFFNAYTQEDFDYWYDNIKSKALYDTGVTAEYGDEFITLSCCSYQVSDGRFIVIGKRIK